MSFSLMISGIFQIVNVLPITSRKQGRKIYPNEFLISSGDSGLEKESIVLCYQIRTLDKRRLVRKIGKIENVELQEGIIDALCFQYCLLHLRATFRTFKP